MSEGPVEVWSARPHLRRQLGAELLVAPSHPAAGDPIRLNPTGATIWERVVEGAAFDTIVDGLDPTVDRVKRSADVAALLEQLEANGLVQPGPLLRADQPGASRRQRSGGRTLRVAAEPLWKLLATQPADESGDAVDIAAHGEPAEVIDRIERSGSLGQLAHAIRLGRIEVTAEEFSQIQDRWAANQMHCLRVEQMLLVALELLDAAEVPHRVLKGVAVAHLDHPDPGWREFGDADLLVAEGAWDVAVEVLRSDPLFQPLFGNMVHPFGAEKGVTMLTPDMLMLDLHKRLSIGGLGTRPVDMLFRDAETFVLGGREVLALNRPGRLVHALLHWFSSKPIRRGTMRDLMELSDADPVAVADLARELQLTGVMQQAARLVGEELDVSALRDLADGLRPTATERVLAARRGDRSLHRNVLWRELTGLALTPGVRGRLDYASARVLPSAEFREQRQVTWRTYASVLTGRRIK